MSLDGQLLFYQWMAYSMKYLGLIKSLLLIPIVILGLSLLISLFASMGPGTFHADYYYLPLRDFVPSPQRDAMEEKVIDLFNAKQQRVAVLTLIRDALCLACLVLARVFLAKVETHARDG